MAEYYLYQKAQCIIVIKEKSLKEHVARELLSNLTETKVPLLRNTSILNTFFKYKMKERVNNLLLAGDKCKPEIHLKLPGFIKVFVDHSIKIKKEERNLKK